jgi:hypothetical protein
MDIQYRQNVFNLEEVKKILGHVMNESNRDRWYVNKHNWGDEIKKDILGCVNILFIRDEDIIKMITDKFVDCLNPSEKFGTIQYYEWNQLSQINWHNDGRHNGSITIYLNEKWDANWGGFFCWKQTRENINGNFIIPEMGSAIVLRNGPPHFVSLVSPYADTRKTIQIFIRKCSG